MILDLTSEYQFMIILIFNLIFSICWDIAMWPKMRNLPIISRNKSINKNEQVGIFQFCFYFLEA